MVKVISGKEFDEVKKADVAIVDFFATWCGPCKMMGPLLDEISEEYDGRVSFFKLDVDGNQELAAQYGVNSIPNLCCFKKGEKVSESVGFRPAEDIKRWIDSELQE